MNGKTWRLLKSWYNGASCRVKCDGVLSESFMVERGVKQRSVLSPTLFLLVMDPLLKQLEASGLGLSVNNFYAGGFLHADDIRTLATSADSLSAQVALVKKFTEDNFQKLNVQKCEVVVFDRGQKRSIYLSERSRVHCCPVGLREFDWATGGGETWLHVQLRRAFGKPGDPLSILEALGLSRQS